MANARGIHRGEVIFISSELKHNLFAYATSELSQDAFLCWLFSYAMDDEEANSAPELQQCARNMLNAFASYAVSDKCVVTCVLRQYQNIDVLLRVRDGERKCVFIIEDKVGAREHGNQLVRYKQNIENSDEFMGCQIYCVYYKAGLQNELYDVNKAGYKAFTRNEILNLLKPYAKRIQNDVFQAYYLKLKYDDDDARRYGTQLAGEWEYPQIEAFLNDIAHMPDLGMAFEYGYVSNPSGGFLGMWTKSDTLINNTVGGVNLYIQLEFRPKDLRICLKADIPNAQAKESANEFLDAYIRGTDWSSSALHKLGLTRPHRLRGAQHMTIGFFPPSLDDICKASADELIEAIKNAIRIFPLIAARLTESAARNAYT